MDIQKFVFNNTPVRTVLINEEPWFVAKDVADILEYSDTQAMTRRLDKDEVMSDKLSGMNMKSLLINESGLYSAILGSKKPEAKKFKRWVTHEVLPQIRKTGSYSVDIPTSLGDALRLAAEKADENDRLRFENTQQKQLLLEHEPKIQYIDTILSSTTTVTITQIAKDYGLTGYKLNKVLHDNKIQYKQSNQWLLYDKYAGLGYTKSSTASYTKKNGNKGTKLNTKWTQKGRIYIHNLLTELGVVANMDKEMK